jgi:hypothetical protein
MIGKPFYAIAAAIRGRVNQKGHIGAETLSYYTKSLVPPTPPIPPVINYSDLMASIRCIPSSTLDIYANLRGILSSYEDLRAHIRALQYAGVNIYGNIRSMRSSSTQPLSYTDVILGTKGGFSIFRKQTTKTPDITASLHGWDTLDLTGKIRVFGTDYVNLYTLIRGVKSTYSDIYANIVSMYIKDIIGDISGVGPSDIYGNIFSIAPKDILATIGCYHPADIYVYCGASPPKDIFAILAANQPVDIRACIRSGFSSIEDITATLVATGKLINFYARIRSLESSYSDMFSTLNVRGIRDLIGYISGWAESDITASIKGWNGKDISAHIWASYVENVKDIHTFIRPSFESTSDAKATVHGWVRTHTSDKLYNFYLRSKLPKKILLGFKKGLTIMEIEPVYGYFPDLHASITAMSLYVSYINAFIRGTERSTQDLSTVASPVSKYVCMSKVAINFVNMSNLYAIITSFSGYRDLKTSIIGTCSTSTSTSSDAGWIYRSLSVKFLMGTSGGLYIPQLSFSRIRSDIFINHSDTPDLWAYLRGWAYGDITASISVQPYDTLLASVSALDLSHTKYLYATLYPTRYMELTASLTGVGAFMHLGATITPSGSVGDIRASIYPYMVSSGYRIIRVDTKPYKDLYADINMGYNYGVGSAFKDLHAFIRGSATYSNSSSLYATIDATTDIKDITADLTGRKVSRIRTLRFIFRPKNRCQQDLYSLISGVGSAYTDMSASIVGDYLTSDITASIYVSRYRYFGSGPEIIEVYKRSGQFSQLYRKLKLSLKSKIDNYVYDSILKTVYQIGDSKWVLKLSELSDSGEFYDRNDGDRSKLIDDLTEFGSIDEAIRGAITWLTDRNTLSMYADISPTGSVIPFYATIYGRLLDAQKDLITKIVPVSEDPIIYASIQGIP